MKVSEIMEKRAAFSFEVFPPKTDRGMEKLCGENGVLDHLYALHPDYISCTYGAAARTLGGIWMCFPRLRPTANARP